MSEIASPPSVAGRRPSVVAAAGYLLFGAALLILVLAVVPLPYLGHVSDTAKRAYANIENGATIASTVSALLYVGVAIDVIAAAGLAVLGVFNLRGSNAARITTWVIAGIGVLCCGSSALISRAATGMSQNSNQPNAAQMQAAQKQLQAAYPSWYSGLTTTVTVLVVLLLILVIILLALPASSQFFSRRKAQLAEPALPGLPYPHVGGEPPYPQASGEPPYPQASGEPPVPPSQRDQ